MRSRPVPGLAPFLRVQDFVPTDVRVVATRATPRSPAILSLDALIGGDYSTRDGGTRALLYLTDHRHFMDVGPHDVEPLLRSAAQKLYLGLEVLWHRYQVRLGHTGPPRTGLTMLEREDGTLQVEGLRHLLTRLQRVADAPEDPYIVECAAELARSWEDDAEQPLTAAGRRGHELWLHRVRRAFGLPMPIASARLEG